MKKFQKFRSFDIVDSKILNRWKWNQFSNLNFFDIHVFKICDQKIHVKRENLWNDLKNVNDIKNLNHEKKNVWKFVELELFDDCKKIEFALFDDCKKIERFLFDFSFFLNDIFDDVKYTNISKVIRLIQFEYFAICIFFSNFSINLFVDVFFCRFQNIFFIFLIFRRIVVCEKIIFDYNDICTNSKLI